jgi:arsenate reductase
MLKIYHNNQCGKSRECLKILEDKEIDFQEFHYLTEPISEKEIQDLLKKLKMKPLDIIRQKETIFIEKYKGKTLTDNEWIQAIIANPILIERPIVIGDNWAVVARPPEIVLQFI